MRLVVNQYLNARTGAPSTEVAAPFYRAPGFILNIDNIHIGTELEGNSVWYHNEDDGCYYWSGAVGAADSLLEGRQFTRQELLNIYRSAVNELTGQYRSIPGFRGIACGFKETGEAVLPPVALIFYVDRKIPAAAGQVPATINYRGILLITEVRETGQIALLADNEADNANPLLMGGSLSEDARGKTFGTRTLIVTKDKKDYLLTCFHVACNSLFENRTYFLGNSNVFVTTPSPFITQTQNPLRLRVVQGGFNSLADYALIEIEVEDFVNIMPDIQFNGFYTKDELKAKFDTTDIGETVVLAKYGAATQAGNRAVLKTYHAESIKVNDAPPLFMSGLIEAGPMSGPGDSGAPVVDVSNNKLVGFVVAGSSTNTFILPFAQLLFELSIKPKL